MKNVPSATDLPAAILTHDQWVCWQTEDRDGKQTKIPIDPSSGRYASTTDSSTWTGFEQACEYAVNADDIEGLGFVFTDDDPFVGVDLDNCRDEAGDSPTWATDIIDQLDSYTEISPSGTGYHIIVRGALPSGPNRRGDVECYETARYFTVTGESVHDPARPVAERTTELEAVHTEYVADEEQDTESTAKPRRVNPRRTTSTGTHMQTNTLDDEAVLEKAHSASNGPKFERLWSGSTSGYDSHSEADMGLCFMLAFWTGGDTVQMDRLFRRSGLLREKWDEVHFSDGSTYGEKTVERAVTRVDEVYDPSSRASEEQGIARPPEREALTETDTSPREGSSGSDQHNQRLIDVVDQLEARVDELEAENEALRDALQKERNAREGQQRAAEDASVETRSLWSRMTARFGNDRND